MCCHETHCLGSLGKTTNDGGVFDHDVEMQKTQTHLLFWRKSDGLNFCGQQHPHTENHVNNEVILLSVTIYMKVCLKIIIIT